MSLSDRHSLGKDGEEMAARYLESKGYCVLARNWRSGRIEIDIIARKDRLYVFVEVKTRRNLEHGRPEEAVSERKMRGIVRAADSYLRAYHVDNPVRFDIVSVLSTDGRHFEINHIEDAFYPLAE